MVIQPSVLDKEGRSKGWESDSREKELGENSEKGSGCRADLVFYPVWIRLSYYSHISVFIRIPPPPPPPHIYRHTSYIFTTPKFLQKSKDCQEFHGSFKTMTSWRV